MSNAGPKMKMISTGHYTFTLGALTAHVHERPKTNEYMVSMRDQSGAKHQKPCDSFYAARIAATELLQAATR